MKRTKPTLVFIDGSQGGGKTTVTNYLRENITSTNLLRLSGCKSNNIEMPYLYHKEMLNMVLNMGKMGIDNNVVFDRTYFSEWVYRKLGYKGKETDLFDKHGMELSTILEELTNYYTVIFIPLILTCPKQYEERLSRDKATYECAPFDAKKSMEQQTMYLELSKELSHRAPNVIVKPIDTSITTLEEITNIIKEIGDK